MRTILTITTPILAGEKVNPSRINEAIARSAAELERDIKLNIQQSTPTGRTYPIGPILRNASRRNAGLGLRTRGRRVTVGYRIHRASREGQPPAIRTGRLINSIRGRRIGPFRYRVGTSVVYAGPLDAPDGLNRPFFASRVNLYRPKFRENIRRAILR